MKDKPESLPDSLVWNPELAFPLGTDRFGMNAESGFDTTLFELDSITHLPQWVLQVEVLMEGTADFDLSALGDESDYIDQILFRINLYNDFPHEVLTQAYFRRPRGPVLDSMFSEGPLPVPAAEINSDGSVKRRGYVQTDASFDRDEISSIMRAMEIYLRARIPHPEVDSSPLILDAYRSYELVIDAGVMTRMNYSY